MDNMKFVGSLATMSSDTQELVIPDGKTAQVMNLICQVPDSDSCVVILKWDGDPVWIMQKSGEANQQSISGTYIGDGVKKFELVTENNSVGSEYFSALTEIRID